jgi:cell division transport system permease protein
LKKTRKKKLGSFPFITVIFSITLSLFIIGLLGAIIIHSNTLSEYIRNNIELHVYLEKGLSTSKTQKLETILASKGFTNKKGHISSIQYISEEDALERYIADLGENPVDVIGYNPLRPLFTIKIAPEFSSLQKVEKIKMEIESMKGVYEVDLNNQKSSEIDLIFKNIKKIVFFLLFFSAASIVTISILINNTIKLALFSQRFLIRSMQLVGATSSFIRWPFIRSAIFYGFSGGIIASLSIYLIISYGYENIPELQKVQSPNELLILLAILPTMGIFVAVFSTFRAIGKYLKMSLDELY